MILQFPFLKMVSKGLQEFMLLSVYTEKDYLVEFSIEDSMFFSKWRRIESVLICVGKKDRI